MESRDPGDVVAQMRRVLRTYAPGMELERLLTNTSGFPWDWLREDRPIEILAGTLGVVETGLAIALESQDPEVGGRAERIRAPMDAEATVIGVVGLPPEELSRWVEDRFLRLGDEDWEARENATDDLLRFREALLLSLAVARHRGSPESGR